jgi:putative hemolysin
MMATSAESLALRQPGSRSRSLNVGLAQSDEEILACQKLRYQVFVEELGARIESDVHGIDRDNFDRYCKHLMVRDEDNGQVVATTRLLTDREARQAGMFYSQSEFDLTRILSLPGRFLEIGRTCIHPDYRRGSGLAVLWQGVARLMVMYDVDYLIGCASIPLDQDNNYAASVMHKIRKEYFAAEHLRVYPKIPLPTAAAMVCENVVLPPLLKGYMRSGALICGEPCWDEAFNVADVFTLLDRNQLDRRYVRHFVNRA